MTSIRMYVLKKVAGEESELISTNQLFFDRRRTITIHDGYMPCSCGGVQRYLMPYRHVCDVICNREYYEPSIFHIGWHKLYNYYQGTKYGAFNEKRQLMFCSHYSK